MSAKFSQHVQEILLLQSSLLPGEILQFTHSPDSCHKWQHILDEFSRFQEISPQADSLPAPQFVIKVNDVPIWLEVQFSSPSADHPSVSVKGNVSRDEQLKWTSLIEEKTVELIDSDYPTYELISSYLLPLLHQSIQTCSQDQQQPTEDDVTTISIYHALVTSHHLVSPNKRRSLQQWSSSLSIEGFAKVGYPGVIYVQGLEDGVHEFVRNVKSMQWLALRVRFVESLPRGDVGHPDKPWLELEKVGEVVEYMRRIGREKYIVETGIGSVGLTGR